MAQKQFNRFGLRRDLNLSDLPSATAALNNILSNPTMLGSEASFTTEDLEPIQGIYITNITASTFNSLDGVTVPFTIVENGIVDNSSNPKVYRPLIKIKNRLDAAYFSTGEPFFFGGDGPNATYYDNQNIVRDAPAKTAPMVKTANGARLLNFTCRRPASQARSNSSCQSSVRFCSSGFSDSGASSGASFFISSFIINQL